MPLEKIATLLQDRFGLTVTPGGLAQVLHRAARVAAPTYAALCVQIRGSPVVSPDETGWRVGAVLHWLWAFATPETTVYAIRPGRSFDDAVTILGADFAGVLVRDGWAPYRRFTGALHQSCLAHLFRRCRTLRADHPRSPWAARGQAVLTDALALRDRRDAHAITEQSLAGARGRLLARLGRLIDTAPALPAAQRFARHLDREFPAVLAFLWAPDVDATNWRAEHAIGYAYQSLSTAEAALFDRYYNAPGDKHLEFCQLFGPDKIVANLGGFLGYFMIRKVVAGQDLKRAAGTVTKKLSTWLAAQGHVAEDEAQEGADLGAEAARDLPKAERAARILYDATTNRALGSHDLGDVPRVGSASFPLR